MRERSNFTIEMAFVDRLREVLSHPPTNRRGAEIAAEASKLLAEFFGLVERADQFLSSPEEAAGAAPGSDLTGLTLHEAARRVLEDAGHPLSIRELGRRIRARGWQHPRSTIARPEQIYHQLSARLPKHPDTFELVSRGTFGLRGWNDPDPKRPKPRLGVFSAPGAPSAEEIAGRGAEIFEGRPWRSS